MLWLVFTTGKCNLKCTYCGGSFERDVVPYEVKYDQERLKRLIESDPQSTVVFYGGEPLANWRFVAKFVERVKARRYGVQTNGTLVKLLPEKYWRRMDFALLSIDGRRHTTDLSRGKGVHDRVIGNAYYLKELGLELIARMTVTQRSDLYEEVKYLLDLGLFDKVHWQLNVVWTEKWDVREWADRSYLPGVRKLASMFLDSLRRGKVLRIVPFLGVLSSHFFGGYRGSPCGAGYAAISVSTDGRILSCPIAVREDWAVLGTVEGFSLMQDPLPEPCRTCELVSYCGGRCLYSMKEMYWGWEGFMEVDYVTKEFIREVLKIVPEVEDLAERGVIRLEELKYDPTMDSTEVIP
jgi:putative peptide-modifying radical SAM enzyme